MSFVIGETGFCLRMEVPSLLIPVDREGAFKTEPFDGYQRSEEWLSGRKYLDTDLLEVTPPHRRPMATR